MKKMLNILALGLITFCVFIMAGCDENYKLPVTIYTTENESMRQTTDITCMVKQMYTTEHNKSSNAGMVYGYGQDGFGYAIVPNAKTYAVKTRYVVLEDDDGVDLRFIVEEKDYNLFSEGEVITIQYTQRFTEDGTPYDTANCWFYWGTSRLTYDSNVTEQINNEQEVNALDADGVQRCDE